MDPIAIARAPLSIGLVQRTVGPPKGTSHPRWFAIRAAVSYYTYTVMARGLTGSDPVALASVQDNPAQPDADNPLSEDDRALLRSISEQLSVRDDLTIFLTPRGLPGGALALSGSLAVSFVKALAFSSGIDLGPREAAAIATRVACGCACEPVVSVDSYASAYGGLTWIERGNGRTNVKQLPLSPEAHQVLQRSLMLFIPSASTRSAPPVPADWTAIAARYALDGTVRRPREWLRHVRGALNGGDLGALGALLEEAWVAESQVSDKGPDPLLVGCYQAACANGALGGCVDVAGGQSRLILCCPEEAQPKVVQALNMLAMVRCPLSLARDGVEVLTTMPTGWAGTVAMGLRLPDGVWQGV